jgi:predicted dehydrogenase
MTLAPPPCVQTEETVVVEPARLGFVGVGGTGRQRLGAIATSGLGDIVAIFDPDPETALEACSAAPGALVVPDFAALLQQDLAGLVITAPAPLQAEQAAMALRRGLSVFCQAPLSLTAEETRGVIDTARRADRLLGVDMSYRHPTAMRVLRSTVQAGELGDIYAVDVAFHNASGDSPGPEVRTAHVAEKRGLGCVTELGTHVLDLALWTLGFPRITGVASRLYSGGERITRPNDALVEDYATAMIDLDTGVTLGLACSWDRPAGEEAHIQATFYGTEAAASFRNVNGSLTDFTAELFRGTHRHTLATPPDHWVGRAAVGWTRAVSMGGRYDPWVEGIADVAAAADRIDGR